MKLLLDQGLPRSTIENLANIKIKASHVGSIGMGAATDAAILLHAEQNDLAVVTLDADFHALLAKSGAERPSVIRIRIEGLRSKELAALLQEVLALCAEDIRRGAVVSVTENSVRIRRLPLVR